METAIANAASSPASIVPASAVLAMRTSGQSTAIAAVALLSPPAGSGSFAAVTVAVLTSVPQSSGPWYR